jgi:hypothetical protein
MAVVKRKRKESQFEVFHHFYKVRKNITDLLLRDFGYSAKKSDEYLSKIFGGRPYEELKEHEQKHYNLRKKKTNSFEEWFILDQRQAVMDCLRSIMENIFVANSIYPSYPEELVERRIYQDKAIGQCYRLLQELQYAIETLPVDMKAYLRFANDIEKEITLLKGWRKSDNKFKRVFSESATNFANVNNNGNANNNNASNSNGVRPDFKAVDKEAFDRSAEEKGENILPYGKY